MLVRRVGLIPEEVARLRLSDLHLAGKDPKITFGPSEGGSSRAIDLDLETHRVLVGWLVARPDSASDFLILNESSKPMDPLDIEQAVETFEQADLDLESKPVKVAEPEVTSEPDKLSPDEDFGKGAARSATSVSPLEPIPTIPPPSAPEMGTPPPGFTPARPLSPFPQPPTSAPEEDEATDIPVSFPPNVDAVVGAEPAVSMDEDPGRFSKVGSREKSERMPKSVRQKKVRVPPKPVRKKDAAPTPVIVQRKGPDQMGGGDIVSPRPDVTSGQPVTADHSGRGRPIMLSFAVGGVLVALLVCVVCVGGVGWFARQSETGQKLLAGLGFSQAEPGIEVGFDEGRDEATVDATDVAPSKETPDLPASELTVSPINSPLATPTLPATNTPTLLPPTFTPLPSETATPVPEEVQPPPTDTPVPVPTETPVPPDTPAPEPPPATQVPADTPTPAVTPTPTLKYEAPVLMEPKTDANFIAGNTIVLRWEPVGQLAPDEQYAVRMIYPYNTQPTYQGGQTKETEWIVPLSLYGQIDPPENRYEWFVVVERLNDDGSGTAISPESERWSFVWR
jgi:hypothetical protein